MSLAHLVILSVMAAAAVAEVVVSDACPDPSQDCSVGTVRITPCTNPKRCVLVLGSNVTLSFDFTPNFAASKLKTEVCSPIGGEDQAFAGMGSANACELTTCPTVPGTAQIMDYSLHLGAKLPKGSYTIKWKVWNEDNPAQKCCFQSYIKLKKPKSK